MRLFSSSSGTVANSQRGIATASFLQLVAFVFLLVFGSILNVVKANPAAPLAGWGYRVGDGTELSYSTPVGIAGLRIISVSAGHIHSVALKSDGGVISWGHNTYSQLGNGTITNSSTPVAVSGLDSGVVAISSGEFHVLALKSSGSVVSWGRNSAGALGNGSTADSSIPVAVSGLNAEVKAVSGGGGHSLALKSDGSVWAWGLNGYGQLGNGTTTNNSVPVAVSGLSRGVVAISGGGSHSLALKSDGSVWAWGYNDTGQLGNGSTTNSLIPVAISGLGAGVKAISAGSNHSLALKSDGSVWAWGYNGYGQLGDGTNDERDVPVALTELGTGITAVAAGDAYSLALKSDGSMMAWGGNFRGQLGDGTTFYRFTPAPVEGISDVFSIAACGYHALALQKNGSVMAWGENDYGQTGDGTTINATLPVPVIGLSGGITAVSSSNSHQVALKGDGSVVAWGYNAYGQVGDGTTNWSRLSPVAVSGLDRGVTAISAGEDFSLALKSDGTVVAWGSGSNGRLGDGRRTDSPTPVMVTVLHDVIAISAGGGHAIALERDGSVWAWGNNYNGQLGDGTTISRYAPVAVSGLSSGVIAISAGVSHCLALKSNGSVVVWGTNNYGELASTQYSYGGPFAVPSLESGVIAISAGEYYSLALKNNGSVVAWGHNNNGQLGDGTTRDRSSPVVVSNLSSGVVAISAGYTSSLALKSDGGVLAWGSNESGQLGNGTPTDSTTPVATKNSDGSLFSAFALDAGYGTCLAIPGVSAKANNLAFSTFQNTSKSFSLTFSNTENRPFTWQVPSGTTQGGTISGAAPNLVYTPRAGFSGIDAFSYRINDSGGLLYSTGTVTISVYEASSVVTTVDESPGNLDGVTSLREAILYSNSHPGPDTISFAIPGTGIKTIRPTSQLPPLTAGAQVPNFGTFLNAIGRSIVLDGSLITASANGLVVTGNDCKIQGLTIQNFNGSGVWVHGSASRIIIGGVGAGEANTITNNRGDGVRVTESASGVSIRGNRIFSNSALCINLVPSSESGSVVTVNDIDKRDFNQSYPNLTDSDSGPNGLQNFPVITGMTRSPSTNDLVISGILYSNRDTNSYQLDFYGSTDSNQSGYGEGERYLSGFANLPINTDGSGQKFFTRTIPHSTLSGINFITVTATNANGATSEYSQTQSLDLPVVSYFTDIEGTVGTLVQIYGANFPGVTQVRFGPTNAQANFTIRRPDLIEAFVPMGAQTGAIHLQNGVGTSTSSSNFTVLNNDPFVNTIKLLGDGGTLQSTNATFTAQSREPAHAGTAAKNSAWFEWRPTRAVTVSLDTRNSHFDTRLAVYTAQNPSSPSVDTLNAVPGAQNDDEGPGLLTSRVVFNANGNTTYYIAVDGKGASSTGTFNLTWSSGGTASPTIFWNFKDTSNQGASGSWENPSNWNLNRIPNSNDIVGIDLPGNYTVQMDGAATIQGIKLGPASNPLGTQTLDLNGKILTLTNAKSVVNGNGVGNRGRIVLRPGSVLVNHVTETSNVPGLAINGWLDWQGGTLAGRGVTGITGSGLLQLSSANLKTLSSHILKNSGNATWSDGGNWQFAGGSIFYNSSLFSLLGDADLTSDTSATTFSNQLNGVFRKAAGTGVSTSAVKFNNLAGVVESSAGTLSLRNGGTNSRAFAAGPSGVLECTGTYFFDTQSATFGPTQAGAGTLRLAGQQIQVKDGAQFRQNGGHVEVPAGSTLQVDGTYTQSSGTTRIDGGTIAMPTADAPLAINGGSLVGSGVVSGRVVCAGSIVPLSNGTATNRITPRATAGEAGNLNIAELALTPMGNLVFNVATGSNGLPLYAHLIVNSPVTFGGKITLQPLAGSGFVFRQGHKFEVLRAVRFVGGDFAPANKVMPAPPANTVWRAGTYADYNPASYSSYVLSLLPSQGGGAITITTPANGATLAALPEIQGAATAVLGGMAKVDLFLRRPVVTSGAGAYQYWARRSGTLGWAETRLALSATLSSPGAATSAWKCVQSDLPNGPNLSSGDLELFARASDASTSPIYSSTTAVWVQASDTIAPTIAIATPANNALIKSLTAISGTASDNVGVTRVDLYLQRKSDSKFWNGSAWTASTPLPTVLSGAAPKQWIRNSALPAGANLLPGAYFLAARAYDASGNGTSATLNFSVTAGDTTPPTIAIATPANNATVASLPSITGTTRDNVGVTRVDLYLQRKSDNKFWNGSTWVAPATPLATVFNGFAPRQWSRTSGLPSGANLASGAYFMAARAYDGANNGTSATANFTVDKVAPAITILAPANNVTIASLPSINGIASDNTGVTRVDLYLQRKSDGKFWNGSAWTTSTPLSTVLSSLAPRKWARSTGLPVGANLAPGAYFIAARAYDTPGNGTSATINFTIVSGASVATTSPIQLSTASAKSDGTIKLTFTGVLGAGAAEEANYIVSQNSVSLDVQSVQQPSASEVVVTADSLTLGARIVIAYDLKDTQGRSITGTATVTVK